VLQKIKKDLRAAINKVLKAAYEASFKKKVNAVEEGTSVKYSLATSSRSRFLASVDTPEVAVVADWTVAFASDGDVERGKKTVLESSFATEVGKEADVPLEPISSFHASVEEVEVEKEVDEVVYEVVDDKKSTTTALGAGADNRISGWTVTLAAVASLFLRLG